MIDTLRKEKEQGLANYLAKTKDINNLDFTGHKISAIVVQDQPYTIHEGLGIAVFQ